MEIFTSTELISALLGVLIGAGITWRMTHWFDRRRNAADLYAHFCSFEMERVRHEAGKFLRRNLQENVPITFEQMHCEDFSEELSNVTRLLNFWEKTEHLVEFNYVDRRFARSLLQHYFQSHLQQFLAEFSNICEQKDSAHYLHWSRKVRKLAQRWAASA